MKKEKQIVVAIDFSKCSVKALEYAICVANKVTANVLMVHVDKPEYSDSIYSKRGVEHKNRIIENFENLTEKYQPSMKGKLEYKIRKGKVFTEIANQAKYSDAYMLFTGTHGVSGYEPSWIGSNTFKLVSMSPCPILTIRDNYTGKHKHIGKILLPIDSTMETRQKVPIALGLAKYFKSDIYVLGIYTTSVKTVKDLVKAYVKQTVEFIEAEGINCLFDFKFCEEVSDAIIECSNEIKADLVVIMTEQETKTKNIWLGPYAQQIVNHSEIPVLSVQAKDIYDAHGLKD